MLTHLDIALDFFVTIYCWQLDKYRSQFIEYQENKQPRKISERKMCMYRDTSEKWAFHILIQKNCVILYAEKANHILGSAEKGAIWPAHPYYAIYRKLPRRGMPSCRESNECRDCSDVRTGKSSPVLFSYLLYIAPATKRP